MKLLKQLFFYLFLILSFQNANAQYQMILQNDSEISDREYEFDVFIVSTSGSFTLTSYQVCFSYNTAIANGGTITFSYLDASSGLSACLPLLTQLVDDAGTSNLICGSNPGSQSVTTAQLKIGRFKISNDVAFAHTSVNIGWDFVGDLQTEVNISNINVAAPANHLNLLGNNPLPVELVDFSANEVGNDIVLKWGTASETNNYGFDIERQLFGNDNWKKVGFVIGNGNSNSTKEYLFKDLNPVGGSKFNYRLKQIDIGGNYKYSSTITVKVLPKEFSLKQNYPNPFNPTTIIRYELPKDGFISLKIYDVLGKEVKTLLNEYKNAGRYELLLHAENMSSGIYIYQLVAGSFTSVKKMLLIK